jgi:hypothetical protein
MRRFAAAIFLLSLIGGAAAEPRSTVTLGGTLYKVPVGYLGYPLKPTDNGFLVNALWPDMKALTSAPDIRKVGNDQVLIILVHDAQSTTSVQFRFDVTKKRLAPLRARGDAYGLHLYLASTRPIGDNDKERYGSIPEDLLFDQLLTDSDSEPSVFLDCTGDRAARMPICTEVFNSNGLMFQMTFAKLHLNKWKSIQASAIDLLKSFSRKDTESN